MAKKPTTTEQTPHREDLFNMAVNAAKQGQKQGARHMFRQIVEQDRRNIRAIMWLAKLAPNEQERIAYLTRALEIKPGYPPAQEALDKLGYDKTAKRNQRLFRIGIGAYVVVLLLVAALMMLSAAAQPAI